MGRLFSRRDRQTTLSREALPQFLLPGAARLGYSGEGEALRIAPQNLERFRQIVLADPRLHQQLRETSDLNGFVALAVRLGAERDCIFTEEEVRAALRECRRAWLERWI
jgi:hypothetical protein